MEVNNKRIFIIIGVFLVTIVAYSLTKNFFINRFTLIEKKQDQIIAELKKIKVETKINPTEAPTFTTIQEIGRLRKELTRLQDQVDEQYGVLGLVTSSPSATPSLTEQIGLNFVRIPSGKWKTVDVHQEKSSSSRIIGQMASDTSYPYTKNEDNYYFVALDDDISGWVHKQFVEEY